MQLWWDSYFVNLVRALKLTNKKIGAYCFKKWQMAYLTSKLGAVWWSDNAGGEYNIQS